MISDGPELTTDPGAVLCVQAEHEHITLVIAISRPQTLGRFARYLVKTVITRAALKTSYIQRKTPMSAVSV